MGTPYRECPNCGAHLDAGELCDCRRSERETRRPEQEPRKPMRLMAICREIDKDTGRIAVYPLKTEILPVSLSISRQIAIRQIGRAHV